MPKGAKKNAEEIVKSTLEKKRDYIGAFYSSKSILPPQKLRTI